MTYSDQATAVAANKSRDKQILFLSLNYSDFNQKMESERALKSESIAEVQTADIRVVDQIVGAAGT